MLPNELSTDLTSLNQNEDRAAVVTEYIVDAQGGLSGQSIYRALVHNRAQLAYSRVGPWLEGKNPLDVKIARVDWSCRISCGCRMRRRRRCGRNGWPTGRWSFSGLRLTRWWWMGR